MTLDKSQTSRLKATVEDYAASLGGSVAYTTYHKQNRYARGFILTHCTDKRIGEIRAYSSGWVYAFDVPDNPRQPRRALASRYVPEIDFENVRV